MSYETKSIWHYVYAALMLANALFAIYRNNPWLVLMSGIGAGAFLIMGLTYHMDHIARRGRLAIMERTP